MVPDNTPPKGRVSALIAKLKADKRLLVAPTLVFLIIVFIFVNLWSTPPDGSSVQDSSENKNSPSEKTTNENSPPDWEYNQQKLEWFVKSGTAPKCKEPFKFDTTPVDMSQITAVGLPGAYRGFSYKAHGGFRAADATGGKVDVKMPMSAYLTGITRYYEGTLGMQPELQYMLDFENDCGVAFRFDHLYALTPDLQALAERTPEPKLNDTASTPGFTFEKVSLKSGQTVATEVGFRVAKNYGFDFGVYDYRERNKISENKDWAAIHESFSAQHFHGVCWLPMLPDADAAKAEAMAKDRNNYNLSKPFNLTSDYCDFAPHQTLEFNNGQPVDG
jgi:hypothetical protein